MTSHSDVVSPTDFGRQQSEVTKVYQEGMIAGVLGAATVAVWHLILDSLSGRPLYTPTVIGTALFRHGEGLEAAPNLGVSFDMVVAVTWVHLLIFVVLGGAASRLLALAERRPNVGFGVLLLFVVFEFGFVLAAMIFAQPVLQALDWPAILGGNLLAATIMAVYFWRRHPNLTIAP